VPNSSTIIERDDWDNDSTSSDADDPNKLIAYQERTHNKDDE